VSKNRGSEILSILRFRDNKKDHYIVVFRVSTTTCCGLGCKVVSTEATGIAPLSATFSKLHARQEILDPIMIITEKLTSEPSNFTQKANLTIPVEKWSEIAMRHANHESLRQLAHEFGVSHETIRQVLIKVS